MRRLYMVVLAVLACALVSVPAASAARVKTKAVAQDKAAVQKYWTAERMRNATPADKTLPGGPAAERGAAALAPAQQIPPPYTSAPTRTNGKVFFSDGGSNYVCSGTAVISPNKSTVWTAGHCVHDGASGFHTNWTFVPAYADGSRPYGTWTARTLVTTSAWANQGDINYDGGFAVMNTLNGAHLTDVVGGQGIGFNLARGLSYNAYGYPAAAPFNGETLKSCSGTASDDVWGGTQSQAITCDMTGGSSGGPWLISGSSTINSLNSFGYNGLRNKMFGPYFGSQIQSAYSTAATR